MPEQPEKDMSDRDLCMNPSEFDIQILEAEDQGWLSDVLPDVFDHPIDSNWTAEFLADPRHHLAIAIDKRHRNVVGMASAVHYIHPDKPPELWINEVGVSQKFRRRGLGTRLVTCLLNHGTEIGCRNAWVLTEQDNLAAIGLYECLGGHQPKKATVMFNFEIQGK